MAKQVGLRYLLGVPIAETLTIRIKFRNACQFISANARQQALNFAWFDIKAGAIV